MSVIARPASLQDAFDALDTLPDAQLLAGGTDFMVEVNFGHRRPPAVVAIRRLAELQGYQVRDDEVDIGAAVTWTTIERQLAGELPALAAAARTVGSPQMRNAATIGGNIATASPAGDGLPVLLAADASLVLASRHGERTVPFAEFVTGVKRTVLQPGEIITRVRVPRLTGPQEFLKVGTRNAMVISICCAALLVDRVGRTVRIGLGSVAPDAGAGPGRGVLHRRRDRLGRAVGAGGVGDPVRRAGARRGPADHRPPRQRRLPLPRRSGHRHPRAGKEPGRMSASDAERSGGVSDALHDPTTEDSRGGQGYPDQEGARDFPLETYVLSVNGRDLPVDDAWVGESLLYVLRERLGQPGSKNACEQGECGSCSVLMDGALVALVLRAGGRRGGLGDRHGRGPGRRGRAVRRPAGLRRAGRGAVRLLHPRHDRRAHRPARPQPRRRASWRCARRSPATCAAAPATAGSSPRSATCSEERDHARA